MPRQQPLLNFMWSQIGDIGNEEQMPTSKKPSRPTVEEEFEYKNEEPAPRRSRTRQPKDSPIVEDEVDTRQPGNPQDVRSIPEYTEVPWDEKGQITEVKYSFSTKVDGDLKSLSMTSTVGRSEDPSKVYDYLQELVEYNLEKDGPED